jgi:NAD+ kinase
LQFIQELEIPVIGVNTGRLGFLASFSKEEIFDHIDEIINKDMNFSRRSVLKVASSGTPFSFLMLLTMFVFLETKPLL